MVNKDVQFLETALKLSVSDAELGRVLRAYFRGEDQATEVDWLDAYTKEQLRRRIEEVQPKTKITSTMVIASFLEGLGRDIIIDSNVIQKCYDICELAQPKYMEGHLQDLKNKASYQWLVQGENGGYRLNSAGRAFVKGLFGSQDIDED